jgi:hypothetical protein
VDAQPYRHLLTIYGTGLLNIGSRLSCSIYTPKNSVCDREPLENRLYDLQACRQNLETYAFGLESVNDGHLSAIAEFLFTGKQNLHHYQRGGRALLSGILACRLKQKCCKMILLSSQRLRWPSAYTSKHARAIL